MTEEQISDSMKFWMDGLAMFTTRCEELRKTPPGDQRDEKWLADYQYNLERADYCRVQHNRLIDAMAALHDHDMSAGWEY